MKFARSSAAVAATGVIVSAGLIGMISTQSADAASNTITVGFNPAAANLTSCLAAAYAQRATADPTVSYVVPTDGTLSDFSYRAVNGTGTVRLVVFRSTGTAGQYSLVGASPVETIDATLLNQLDTFPVQLAVRAGDFLGLQSTQSMNCADPNTGTLEFDFSFDAAQQSAFSADGSATGLTNVSATLQPATVTETATVTATATQTATATATVTATQTATQTATATVPGPTQTVTATQTAAGPTQTVTASPTSAPDTTAPNTFLTKAPRAKIHKRRAIFEFVSTDPYLTTTFQCSVDGAPFTACTSRVAEKFGRGKHTFEVRAVDPAGNIDATPAIVKWKFVPQR